MTFRRHNIVILGLAIAALAALRCVLPSLAGGSSDQGNAMVIGKVVDETGEGVPNTQVQLVPVSYDPVAGGLALPTDTTDESGMYDFMKTDTGDYNLQAVHLFTRTRALIPGIHVAGDTVAVPDRQLQKPGFIKVMLPAGVNVINGYVYIPGTLDFALLNNRPDVATIDSVPAGTVSSVWYSSKNAAAPRVIRYDVDVAPFDTTTIWNPSWKYAKKLVLNTSPTGANVAGAVIDFPALVRLNSANFDFSLAEAEGADIRFTKSGNTFLPFEIEQWDAARQRAEIWVKIDTVRGNNSTQSITLYYGNPEASGGSNGAAVFDTTGNLTAVWHLNQNCGDATGSGHDAVACSAADTAGVIGMCKQFSRSDSIKIAGLLGAPSSITLSAWAQLDSTTPGGGSEIITIGDAALIRMDYEISSIGTGGAVHLSSDSALFNHVGSGRFLKQTGWHFIAMTHDETAFTTTVYIDGMMAGVRTDPIKSINYAGLGQNTYIGKHGNGKAGYDFFGKIDEARVYRTALPADYIKLSYMNQRMDDRLVLVK